MAARPSTSVRKRKPKPPTVIGCAEHIALPELGLLALEAKVDTGAQTTAIHATAVRTKEIDGRRWVSFRVPLRGAKPVQCHARLRGVKLVKNTGGKPERRFFIRTRLHIGERSWPIDVTLANRRNMKFAVILGRAAILHRRVLVDPDGQHLQGEPTLPASPSPDPLLEGTDP